jgi:hypothetical protein
MLPVFSSINTPDLARRFVCRQDRRFLVSQSPMSGTIAGSSPTRGRWQITFAACGQTICFNRLRKLKVSTIGAAGCRRRRFRPAWRRHRRASTGVPLGTSERRQPESPDNQQREIGRLAAGEQGLTPFHHFLLRGAHRVVLHRRILLE